MAIGIIGAGQMGSAIIKGLLRSQVIAPKDLYVKGGTGPTAKKLQKEYQFKLVTAYKAFASCEIIFIAIGAVITLDIAKDLASHIPAGKVIISVAAGHTLKELEEVIGKDNYAVHAMPNTPISVNAGVIGTVFGKMPEEKKADTLELLETLGKVEEMNEQLFNVFGTIAGCSPAFMAIFMEALSDGAVQEGMPRALSYEVIAQTMLGTAKLALETAVHPGELKDSVTSPGGSTIRGVEALERNKFRYAVIEAVKKANK